MTQHEQGGGVPLATVRIANDGAWERALVLICGLWAIVAFADTIGALVESQPDAWIAFATATAILVSALVSSIAGFAFSALAGSALAYLKMDPVRAVQVMALCSIATQLYAVWRMRMSIRWRSLWPMIAAGAVTIPVGVWILIHAAGPVYAVGLGVFLTIYGCYVLLGQKTYVVRGNAWCDALAGALGGLAGGLAGLPAPFVTIWCSMRGLDKVQQRAVYQPYILAMQVVAIGCLWWQAPPSVHAAQDMRLVPVALLGAIGGLALFGRMTSSQFHWLVSTLLVVSGIGLLARAI